jgi:hypothetical protein
MNEKELKSNSEFHQDEEKNSNDEKDVQDSNQFPADQESIEQSVTLLNSGNEELETSPHQSNIDSQESLTARQTKKLSYIIGSAVLVIVVLAIAFFVFGRDPFSDANLIEAGFIKETDDVWILEVTGYGVIQECTFGRSIVDASDLTIIAEELGVPNSSNQPVVRCSAGSIGGIIYFHDFNAHGAQIISFEEYLDYYFDGYSSSIALDMASYVYLYHYEDGYANGLSAPSDVMSDYFILLFDFHDLLNDNFNLGLE